MPGETARGRASTPLALIAAVARNGVIGDNNRLPWFLPGDLKHFKALTMGKPVVMGRRTFDSIRRPLPGRYLVVLSRDPGFGPPGVTVVRSLEDALGASGALARDHGADEVFVAGGGQIYASLIGAAQRLYVTEVACAPDGDTRFPPIDPSRWREVSRIAAIKGEGDDLDAWFLIFERR